MTEETKLAELKPCPFCGSRPKGWDIGAAQGRSPRWLLECANSECLVFVEAECPTEAEAIAAWNTRPVPDDVVGAVERKAVVAYLRWQAESAAEAAERKEIPTTVWWALNFAASTIEAGAHSSETEAAVLLTSLASVRDDGWLPIEQAPRDGTEILAFRDDAGILLVRWTSAAEFLTEAELSEWTENAAYKEDWFYADFVSGGRLEGDCLPTHFRPLPAPPTNGGK